jgi:hypothetical protein
LDPKATKPQLTHLQAAEERNGGNPQFRNTHLPKLIQQITFQLLFQKLDMRKKTMHDSLDGAIVFLRCAILIRHRILSRQEKDAKKKESNWFWVQVATVFNDPKFQPERKDDLRRMRL